MSTWLSKCLSQPEDEGEQQQEVYVFKAKAFELDVVLWKPWPPSSVIGFQEAESIRFSALTVTGSHVCVCVCVYVSPRLEVKCLQGTTQSASRFPGEASGERLIGCVTESGVN